MFKSVIKSIYSNVTNYDLLDIKSISTLICLIILLIIAYNQYKFQYWSKYGVKFPPPKYFFGHGLSLISKSRLQYEVEWPCKYGKVYGLYLGTQPRLVVADADILRRICIKDFHLFPNHKFTDFRNEMQKNFLSLMKDDHWKQVRSIITPTFTSGRMRRMFQLMSQCSLEMIELFDHHARNNKELDTRDVCSLYSMDVITTCCFGVKTCLSRNKLDQNDENQQAKSEKITNVREAASRDSFVNAAMKIVAPKIPRLIITFLTPVPILKALNFTPNSGKDNLDLYARAKLIIESRRRNNIKYDDYLQLLMDAEYNSELNIDALDTKESHHVGLASAQSIQDNHLQMSQTFEKSNKIKLNEAEVLANAMFFLFVGYDTTASLMSYCSYALAHHPEVQVRLFQELQTILKENNGQFTYESLTSATYLDAVICETLRLLPPVINLDRVAEQDYRLDEYNITIPKGTTIELSYYAIHHDTDYWPEPEKFDPMRFMPENSHKIVPSSYCPFGIGPRHCVGMRFALTEAKMAISKIISQYQLSPGNGCKFSPSEPARMFFLTKFNNLNIKIKKLVV